MGRATRRLRRARAEIPWLLIAVSLGTACRRDAPRAFVAVGQGSVRDTSTLQITAITVAASANDYDGNPVSAGAGFQYVLLDCHFTVPSNQVDLTDFQLVRERVPETGTETNLGNNDDRDYFYWTYLDQAGQRLTAPPDTTGPFRARLAFKVPADIRAGYLFYWGLYWGPLWFPEGAS